MQNQNEQVFRENMGNAGTTPRELNRSITVYFIFTI